MKRWIIPAVALSVLLSAPAAFAYSASTVTAMTAAVATDHHHDRKPPKPKVNVRVRRDVYTRTANPNAVINGRARHLDFRIYRRNYQAHRRFHWHLYVRPHGWYAHRWVYGEHLPFGWYARDYWITSYLDFGLMAPPPGTIWVRVGNDALLIDSDTGEVIRVVYGVFY